MGLNTKFVVVWERVKKKQNSFSAKFNAVLSERQYAVVGFQHVHKEELKRFAF